MKYFFKIFKIRDSLSLWRRFMKLSLFFSLFIGKGIFKGFLSFFLNLRRVAFVVKLLKEIIFGKKGSFFFFVKISKDFIEWIFFGFFVLRFREKELVVICLMMMVVGVLGVYKLVVYCLILFFFIFYDIYKVLRELCLVLVVFLSVFVK